MFSNPSQVLFWFSLSAQTMNILVSPGTACALDTITNIPTDMTWTMQVHKICEKQHILKRGGKGRNQLKSLEHELIEVHWIRDSIWNMTAKIWLFNPQRDVWNHSAYYLSELRVLNNLLLNDSYNGWEMNKQNHLKNYWY